jgi:hypothetical protein
MQRSCTLVAHFSVLDCKLRRDHLKNVDTEVEVGMAFEKSAVALDAGFPQAHVHLARLCPVCCLSTKLRDLQVGEDF